MDRRRIELQLRLVQAMLRAERRRGHPEVLEAFLVRAGPIVNDVAVAIEAADDPALAELLHTVKAELADASASLAGRVVL